MSCFRPRRSLLGGLALLVVLGCNKTEQEAPASGKDAKAETKADAKADTKAKPDAKEDPAASTEEAPNGTHSVADLLNQVGDGPVVAFVVRPQKWGTTRDAVKPIAQGLPDGAEVAAMAGSVQQLVEFAGSNAGMKLTDLQGVDFERPIVGGLGDAPKLEPVVTPGKGKNGLRGLGLHHVLYVPVSDSKKFIDSLGPALGAGWETVPGWGEAGTWTGFQKGVYLHAVPDGDYARVDMFNKVLGMNAQEAKVELLPRIAVGTEPLQKTPAMQELLGEDYLFGLHIRPWRYQQVAMWSGRNNLIRALDEAPPDMRATMMAKGMSLVLTAGMLMPDAGAEFDDWTWTFSGADSQANVRGVGSLTPHGRKLFDAANTDVALLGVGAKDAPIQASLRIALGAALDAAEPSEAMKSFRRPADAAQAFQECGPGCLVHAVTRAPIQNVDMFMTILDDGGMSMGAASAAQGVLTSWSPPAGAFALLHESENEASKTKTTVGKVGGSGLGLEQATRGSTGVVTGGFGAKAADVFTMTEEASDSMLEVSVSGKGSSSPFEDLQGALRIKRSGPALVAELSVAKGAAVKLAEDPDFSGVSWNSPIVSFPGAGEAQCLVQVVSGIRNTFEVVATVAADQRVKVMGAGISEVEKADACASASPEAKARAKELTELAKGLLVAFEQEATAETP